MSEELYHGKDVGLVEILNEEKLGGVNGLEAYLKMRKSQLQRIHNGSNLPSEDDERLMLAIQSIQEVLNVFENIVENTSKASNVMA
ncbi:hypothetical protein [Epibacterium ulvae]|uniref:hypothetical protein n=1 Tax=Epibacterium ulvae TaxID=1156985 RepID=UPI002490B63D|nr:hypothetical protein [Epibacterium ulvae]